MKRYARRITGLMLACCLMFAVTQSAFAVDMRVAGSGSVNVRSGPSTDAAIITTVSAGSNVDVIEHNPAGWSKVRVNGSDGFIRSDFLTVPTGAQGATFKTTDGVNFRNGPSTDDTVIRVINVGTSVEMIEHDPAGWSKVKISNTVGYIRSDFLSMTGQTVQQTTTASTQTTTTLKTIDGVNLRSGPSTEYRIIKVLEMNTEVSVIERDTAGWTKVNHNGTIGYIRSDLLSASGVFVELLDWSVVRTLINRSEAIRCYDVRTGMTYNVKTLAIYDHHDVEPITLEDTETILATHNGRWSWSARPLWVTIAGRTIAASMHGMPHDVSTNPNNGMNGHLCMHFLGSTTSSTSATYRADLQNAVQEAWNAR